MTEHHLSQPTSEIEAQHSLGLRIIAIYKAIKTVGLLFAAAAAFHLEREQNFDHFVHWLEHLSLTDTNGLRWQLVSLLQQWGPSRFIAVGLVAIGYAAIFATEGTGLWLRKHWAEWFTVIATGSLIPLELYEVFHHFTWLKLVALLGNIAIVVYLVRIAMQPRPKKVHAG
ncbi:membrane protein [Dyella jiangningensis]|nr:membrane protein [Dyella jiangningensis]AHX16053.1 membrane protein [Dyella jiangningensis]